MGGSVPKSKGDEEAMHGAAFRQARNAASKTLLETAEALGVSVNTIRWHEAGASIMKPDKLMTAANLFGADPVDIGAAYRAQRELDELAFAAHIAKHTVTIIGSHAIVLKGVKE